MPALFEDNDHIFDRQRRKMSAEQFTRWSAETFSGFASDCAKHHGAVFGQYIVGLINHGREKATTHVQRRIAEFTHHVGEPTTDGDLARDVAGKFGLLYGAGRVAIELRLVPWSNEELLDAIAKCYRTARDLLPDRGVALRRAIRALGTRVRSLPMLTKPPKGIDYEKLDGYREVKDGVHRFTIKCESFGKTFASTADGALVLDRLIEQGRITLAVSTMATPGSSPKPREQFDWPDGKRRRSFEIVGRSLRAAAIPARQKDRTDGRFPSTP